MVQARITLPSEQYLLGEAFSFWRKHMLLIVQICLLPTAGLIGLIFVSESLRSFVFAFVWGLIFLAEVGIIRLAAGGAKKDNLVGYYVNALKLFLPAVWLSAITVFATFGGFVLFVIPGILVSLYASLSLYTLILDGERGIGAFIASWRLVRTRRAAVLWRLMFMAVTNFAAGLVVLALTSLVTTGSVQLTSDQLSEPNYDSVSDIPAILVSMFFLMPLTLFYMHGIYKAFKASIRDPISDSERDEIRGKILWLSLVGLVIAILLAAFFGFLLVYYLRSEAVTSLKVFSPLLSSLNFSELSNLVK